MVHRFMWLILGLVGMGLLLAVPAQAQTPAQISAIRVDGVERIEPETVRAYLTLKIGDTLTTEGVDTSLKALYATGLFADVSVGQEGAILVVKVVENPIISRVAFEGNRKLESKDLENETQVKPRAVYTRTKIQADVKRLLEIYRRSGRFAATVEPKIIQQPQNRVDVVFEISEGSTTGIGRISFVGNTQFSDSELRDVLGTKESTWYRFLSSDDHYDPDRVSFDRELLRRFYLENGYADFRVMSAAAELSPDRNAFYLTFTVEEGERYKFADVNISTTLKNLDVAALKTQIETKPGAWYDAGSLDRTITLLSNEAGVLGYAFVEIEPEINRDRAARTIGVTFDIREGPKVYVERIDIIGNVRTLDEVVRREFRLVEGDAFNTEKLRQSEKRLRNLGFFKKVETAKLPGSAPDRAVIQTKVEEESTAALMFGGGYSTTDGALLQVNLGDRNFLGKGLGLSLSTIIAQRSQQYDLRYSDPYFLDKELAFSTNIFRITRDLERNSSFDSITNGIGFSLGYLLSDDLRHTYRYILRNDTITNIGKHASRFIREQEGERLSSIVGQTLTYDQLDDRLNPSKGYIISGSTDLSGLGGDVHYIRGEAKAATYYPLGRDYNVSLRGSAGYITGFGNEKVRINDRFFLGGDDLRGFQLGGAGPRDVVAGDALGGNIFYAATLELTVPLGLPKELGVTGHIFTDVGSAFHVQAVGPEVRDRPALRAAAGIGLSWRSALGRINIDLAQPYLKQPYDRTEILHINFGTQF